MCVTPQVKSTGSVWCYEDWGLAVWRRGGWFSLDVSEGRRGQSAGWGVSSVGCGRGVIVAPVIVHIPQYRFHLGCRDA